MNFSTNELFFFVLKLNDLANIVGIAAFKIKSKIKTDFTDEKSLEENHCIQRHTT